MDTSSTPDEILVEQSFESSLESVDDAEVRATEAAESMGFPAEETFRFGYAVREAMVNAVVHGNRYSSNKQVRFVIVRRGEVLEVEISDEGDGFEPAEQSDPLAEENLLNQSGRGLTLIRAFTDEFLISPVQPHGTRATLRKRLPAQSSSNTSAPEAANS